MGWSEVLDEFDEYQRAANLSEKTIRNRRDCYVMLARMSGKLPEDVLERDLLRLLGRMHPRTGQPIAAGTKQSERSYLQTLFTWMERRGHIVGNPAADLPKVKLARRRPRPLRMEQVESILDSGIYRRTRDIVLIAALSGLRIGEIVRIRGEYLDRDSGMLSIRRKGGLEHTIPFHPMLLELAADYPASGWWFPSPYPSAQFPDGGGHILMKSASDRISKAIRAAGITDHRLTGHSLRHFCATMLLNEGVNIRIVQEILGHASLATTQLYTEVTDQQMSEGIVHLPVPRIPSHAHRSHAA